MDTRCLSFAGVVAVLTLSTLAEAQPATLLRDFNTSVSNGSSSPNHFVQVGGTTFFSACTTWEGCELWKTDGTPAGTAFVRDILPGTGSPNLQQFIAFNGQLFFSANDGTHGQELWRSDGTAAGTQMVLDLQAGPGGGNPQNLTVMNGELYFSAAGAAGTELYKTDGTAAGTVRVKDIWLGGNSSNPGGFAVLGGVLYFAADASGLGRELWRSDGTEAGTVLVRDIHLGGASSAPTNLTAAGGKLYFFATTAAEGVELWSSDGTAPGTALVQDIRPGSDSSGPGAIAALGANVVFVANDGASGAELWLSDGTAPGTALVQDIQPGANGSGIASLIPFGTLVAFTANDGVSGTELWFSDGTPGGTAQVDINPGAGSSSPALLTVAGSTLFFSANNGALGVELWASNGTVPGTYLVRDLVSGGSSGNPQNLRAIGSGIYFSGNSSGNGFELWSSDGTSLGTTLIKDINLGGANGTNVGLAVFGGQAFLQGFDPVNGSELWVTDGTSAGTTLFADLNPGGASSSPNNFVVAGSHLYFTAGTGANGTELWRTDGTVAGTTLVRDINPGVNSSNIANLTPFGTRVAFTATDGANGTELWISDGTAGGTVQVDINPGSGSSSPSQLTVVGSKLFFAANDGTSGNELWSSDGTPGGTARVLDIYPGANSSNPASLVAFGGQLYFRATEPVLGTELWRSDGTAGGTAMVVDVLPGGGSSTPNWLTVVGSTLYFTAFEGSTGTELYKTDGTALGTVRVLDVWPGAPSSNPANLVALGSQLLFAANDGATGMEPWVSDGTAAGTVRLADLATGLDTASPLFFAEVLPGVRLFNAATATGGFELYTTNGVPARTGFFQSLTPGPESTVLRNVAVVGDHVVILAGQNSTGLELWSAPRAAFDLSPPQITPSVAGTLGLNSFYVSNVNVSWTVVDAESTPLLTNCGPTVVSTDTASLTLTCTATSVGGTSQVSVVIARDATAPNVTCPGTVTGEATSASGATVSYSAATATDGIDPNPSLGYSHPTGGVFALGTTQVTATATDDAGNQGSCQFNVVVEDTTAPVLNCPNAVTAQATSASGASVNYGSASASDAVDPTLTVIYSHATGSTFGLGVTTVTASATDDSGNQGSCQFDVTVEDTIAPSITCASGVLIEATSSAGAVANYGSALAVDTVDPTPSITYSQASGTVFPLGTTTVTATATDDSGNANQCTLDITVIDTTSPSITCAANQTEEATGPSGAPVSYPPASASDLVTASPIIQYSAASGSTFALGATTVTATAEDGVGNTQSCQFDVTVVDTTSPAMTCPAAVTVEAVDSAGATATFTNPTADDLVDGTLTPQVSHASGATFPLGTTQVMASAQDQEGNEGSCQFNVVVQDTTAPQVTCPADHMVDAVSAAGASVTLGNATASDTVDDQPTLAFSHDSGNFPVGVTTVTVTATDDAGNQASCTFDVTVGDNVDPIITCPDAVTVPSTDDGPRPAQFPAATATDNADDAVEITYSHQSGDTFPFGTTEVTATATDNLGNTATCTFEVRVVHGDAVTDPTDGEGDPTVTPPSTGGCGCAGVDGGAGMLWALAALTLGAFRRRRSRR